MKWQDWRGFVIGIFASLGLIGSAGAGVARAQVVPQVEVLRFRDGMTAPEQLEGKPIVYSAAAIEAGVQGIIEAKCVITVRGTLENCRILKSLPYMDKAVLDALTTRKYTPVTLDGEAVPVEYVFAIKLVLKEKERKCVGSRCDD